MVTSRKARRPSDPSCPSSRRRRAACASLRENVLSQDFVPQDGSPAYGIVDGGRLPLSAYAPYVGSRYFHHRPRILCYAINQNLSRHARWSEDWGKQWARDRELAVDRLNLAAASGKALPIKPYAEGFMPLVAAMALAGNGGSIGTQQRVTVDELIAVTNFVKFSTAEDASSSSIPTAWWRESAKRYVKQEVEVLEPDLIIGFGQRTVRELRLVLDALNGHRPRLLPCRFPGRIPSVKARPLSRRESRTWETHIMPLAKRVKEPPADSYHQWRMLRFPGYFLEIAKSWAMFVPDGAQ